MHKKPTIGIIGAGRLGTVVAKQALKAEYPVLITNSRGPESLTLQLSVLLPKSQAVTTAELIARSDIIVLAIPLNKYTTLDAGQFANKIVIDAMNYWPSTEGIMPEFENEKSSSSEYIQRYLPDAHVIKTLNHVAYHELEEHSQPPESSERRAVALAGDNTKAKEKVSDFISDIGFEPVDLGNLAQGRQLQPDTALFNARYTKSEIKKLFGLDLS